MNKYKTALRKTLQSFTKEVLQDNFWQHNGCLYCESLLDATMPNELLSIFEKFPISNEDIWAAVADCYIAYWSDNKFMDYAKDSVYESVIGENYFNSLSAVGERSRHTIALDIMLCFQNEENVEYFKKLFIQNMKEEKSLT